jgi:ankyrin repeat protein
LFKFANVGKFFDAIKNDEINLFPNFIQDFGFDIVNVNGETPLFYATALGKINSLDIFISYEEMDINQKNLNGQNAAAIACQANQFEVSDY